jgi:hypothetical protein
MTPKAPTPTASNAVEGGFDKAPPLRDFRAWLKFRWVPVVLTIIALVTMGTTIAGHSKAMSPIDEWVYLDYLQKVPTQGFVRLGEPLSQESLGYMACYGQVFFGRDKNIECDGDYNRMEFDQEGTTSAQIYTPIYFAPTSFVGYAIHYVTGIDLIMSWRLASSLWLVAGLLAFLMVLRLFRVPNLVQLMAGILIMGAPFSYMMFSYVSTDAPALLCGSLVAYFGIQLIRGKSRGWPLVVVAAIAGATKGTFVLGVALVALILMVEWIVRAFDISRKNFGGKLSIFKQLVMRENVHLPLWATAMLSATALVNIVWIRLINVLAVAPGVDQGTAVDLTVVELLRQSSSFVFGVLQSRFGLNGPFELDSVPLPSFASAPYGWIFIAGILGGFWALTKKSDFRSLIIGTAIAILTFGPLLALLIRYSTGYYFPFPSRYAAVLVPVLMLIVAIQIRNKWATWLLLSFGLVALVCQPISSFLVTAYSP